MGDYILFQILFLDSLPSYFLHCLSTFLPCLMSMGTMGPRMLVIGMFMCQLTFSWTFDECDPEWTLSRPDTWSGAWQQIQFHDIARKYQIVSMCVYYLNPISADIRCWCPKSEHIHASDGCVLHFLLVCSFTDGNRVNSILFILFSLVCCPFGKQAKSLTSCKSSIDDSSQVDWLLKSSWLITQVSLIDESSWLMTQLNW